MSNIKIRKFRENLRRFERELEVQNNSASCCGVTVTQCHTLLELFSSGKIPLNELSEKLCLDKSTVSRIVESLYKLRLVSRKIPENDRRSTIIELTGKGKKVCEKINKGNDDYYGKAIAAVPGNISENFLKGFEVFVNKMIELNRHPL